MPPSRKIADFFKRPSFAATIPETPPNNRKIGTDNVDTGDSPAAAETSSPLTEPPSSFLEKLESPPSSDHPATRVKQPEGHSAKEETKIEAPEQRLQSVDAENPSRRKVMDGKEVVISSDGEETDSIASLESPEDLLATITGSGSKDVAEEKEPDEDGAKGTRSRRAKKDKWSKLDASRLSVPEYKNTLDSLVTATVDDNETEAGVAKLKAAMKMSEQDAAASTKSDSQDNKLHEGMLTSALGNTDDEQSYQRLLDAVRRTEAFDQEKAWSFFNGNATPLPGPEFPQDCVAPGTYMAVLRGLCSAVCSSVLLHWL